MSETYIGMPENKEAKNNVIYFQAERQKRLADTNKKKHSPQTPEQELAANVFLEKQYAKAQLTQKLAEWQKRVRAEGKSEGYIAWYSLDVPTRELLEKREADNRLAQKVLEQKKLIEEGNKKFKVDIPLDVLKRNILHRMRSRHLRSQMNPEHRTPFGSERIDPLIGERVEDWDFPLNMSSEYQLMGENRPRRFLPPPSAHLENALTPEQAGLQTDEQESYRKQHLIDRPLRAGWVEVAPTRKEYADFLYDKWLKSLSLYEFTKLLLDTQKNFREGKPAPDKPVKTYIRFLIELFFDVLQKNKPKENNKHEAKVPGTTKQDMTSHALTS